MNEYADHKELVDSYLSGQRTETMNNTRISGLSVGMFSVILITVMMIWVASLYLIIKEWDALPTWVRVVSIVDIVLGSGLIAVVCILATKNKTVDFRPSSSSSSSL
jgi:hypothetical protein